MNQLFSFVLFLLLAILAPPSSGQNVPTSSPRISAFDTGKIELSADGFSAALPAPPVGATGYVVHAELAYHFAMTIENRNAQAASYVEVGGRFIAQVGGTWLVSCYGAATPNLAASDNVFWSGHDCRTIDFGADEPMELSFAAPISQWTGELNIEQQRDGVIGWMDHKNGWHPHDWSIPYVYSPTSARLRGWIVWLYG